MSFNNIIMSTFENLLKLANMTASIGRATNIQPKAQTFNINTNRMGYPSKEVKVLHVNEYKTKNHPIHTSKFTEQARANRAQQYSKINNTTGATFVDTNLSSTKNKPIMDEIDMIIEKVRENIETGVFFSIVVADMYRLLKLFEENVFKFDATTLQDYKLYLKDMFDLVLEEEVTKIVGDVRQTKNIVNLIRVIYERIDNLIEIMQQNTDKSPSDRKLIIMAQLRLNKFKKIDTSIVKMVGDEIEFNKAKLKKKNGKAKELAKKQISLLEELIDEVRAPNLSRSGTTADASFMSPQTKSFMSPQATSFTTPQAQDTLEALRSSPKYKWPEIIIQSPEFINIAGDSYRGRKVSEINEEIIRLENLRNEFVDSEDERFRDIEADLERLGQRMEDESLNFLPFLDEIMRKYFGTGLYQEPVTDIVQEEIAKADSEPVTDIVTGELAPAVGGAGGPVKKVKAKVLKNLRTLLQKLYDKRLKNNSDEAPVILAELNEIDLLKDTDPDLYYNKMDEMRYKYITSYKKDDDTQGADVSNTENFGEGAELDISTDIFEQFKEKMIRENKFIIPAMKDVSLTYKRNLGITGRWDDFTLTKDELDELDIPATGIKQVGDSYKLRYKVIENNSRVKNLLFGDKIKKLSLIEPKLTININRDGVVRFDGMTLTDIETKALSDTETVVELYNKVRGTKPAFLAITTDGFRRKETAKACIEYLKRAYENPSTKISVSFE